MLHKWIVPTLFTLAICLAISGCGGSDETLIVPAAPVPDAQIEQIESDSNAARRAEAQFD